VLIIALNIITVIMTFKKGPAASNARGRKKKLNERRYIKNKDQE